MYILREEYSLILSTMNKTFLNDILGISRNTIYRVIENNKSCNLSTAYIISKKIFNEDNIEKIFIKIS